MSSKQDLSKKLVNNPELVVNRLLNHRHEQDEQNFDDSMQLIVCVRMDFWVCGEEEKEL
jgi:hypothetical protein